MNSKRWTIGALVLALASAALAKVEIKVNAQDGQTIAGNYAFKVTVTATDLVNSVEFYVNDDLRESDDSTPYEFTLDTIAEQEGSIKLKIAAYTSEGTSTSKVFTLKIDNEVGKGAEFHVQRGQELLAESKFDDAINAGRVALKAKDKFIPARLLLARANFSKGTFDLAQKFCEDILAEEPANLEALDLNAAIALERAFNTLNRGDQSQTLELIKNALKQAAASRAKVYENRLEALGAPTDENMLKFSDLALQAGRYNRVISLLAPKFQLDPTKASISNRYIFALMRAGRTVEVGKAITIYQRRGNPDAVGQALTAVYLQQMGQGQASLDAERKAISGDANDLTVRSAQATLALMRGNLSVLTQLADSLATTEGQRYEVMFYRSAAANGAGDFDRARRYFEGTVLSEPTSHDAYIQRGNQILGYALSGSSNENAEYQRKIVRAYFEAALNARPESFEALTGLAIVNLVEGKSEESLSLADAATKAGPEYAAGHYTYSLALTLESRRMRSAAGAARQRASDAQSKRLSDEAAKANREASQLEQRARDLEAAATRALETGKKLDTVVLGGRGIPTPVDTWRYFATQGRTPVLIQPQY